VTPHTISEKPPPFLPPSLLPSPSSLPLNLPVRSYEALSTTLPSSLNATALIIWAWPVNFRTTLAVATSQRKNTLSPPQEAKRALSLLMATSRTSYPWGPV